MGRKTGKKKRGAAKNSVPKAAPLVDATVFGGSYSLQVPQGWMHPAEVLATGLEARPSEQFVSRRALSGPGFATLMVDLGARPSGWGSGDQRLMEFLRFHEAENDVSFKTPVEVGRYDSAFERVWLVEYKSVGKLEGRPSKTSAALFESPDVDVILRLNNGDTENVHFPQITVSLRRNSKIPLPPANPAGSAAAAKVLSRLPVPQTIELDFDELEAVAKGKGLDINFLWMVAQAMCYSPAELGSMDAATAEKVDTLRKSAEFTQYRCAAFEVQAVRRRIEDEQRAARGCIEDLKRARAASEKGPPQAASEPVEDPRERARRIEVAAAVCEAAIRALPPHEKFSENARCSRAIENLRDAIATDDSDRENFYEYMQSRKYDGPERIMKFMTRWPSLRKYWPRLRRRICTYCGACVDLSKPRFLVCGGCAEGSGVARYCSETCQAEHWLVHQDDCPLIHTMPADHRPSLRKIEHTLLRTVLGELKSKGFSPEDMSDEIVERLKRLEVEARNF